MTTMSPPMEVPITRKEVEEQTKLIRWLVDVQTGKNKTLELEQKAIWDDTDMMRYFGFSLSTLERRRRDGTFPFFRVGASYRYRRDEILQMVYQKNKTKNKKAKRLRR